MFKKGFHFRKRQYSMRKLKVVTPNLLDVHFKMAPFQGRVPFVF